MGYNQNIIPKYCSYGCNTRIYWNTATSVYCEVFTTKRHICPNRVNNNKPVTVNTSIAPTAPTTTSNTKPIHYSKKPWSNQPKQKISNSLELLTGPTVDEIQKKYEILSNIISEYNGKVHGSQSHMISNNSMSLIVYFEVPYDREMK